MRTHPEIQRQTEPSPQSATYARQIDGWRVVTGVITTLLFGISMLMFAGADSEHREAEECARHYVSSCYYVSDDWALLFLILGVWMMAFATCFGLATIAPFGVWRRAFLIAPIGILGGPFAVYLLVHLVLSSPVLSAVLLAITAVFIILVRVEDRRKARGPGNARSQR